MNLKNLFKLSKMLTSLSETTTDKGVLITEAELVEGVTVSIIDESGELVVPKDGEYLTEDSVIEIKDGVVVSIHPKENEIEIELEEADAQEELNAIKEENTTLKEKIAELEAEKEALVAELEDIKKKLAEPVENPISLSKVTYKDNPVLKYFK